MKSQSTLTKVSLLLILILVSGSSAFTQTITTPESFLGFKPGADFNLANYEQAMQYYDLLASQSNRMIVLDMGPTSAGRRQKYAVISSEANLANLERYKQIARRLTLARGVSAPEAEQLANEGKAIIWIDAGLHATEVAPGQHHIQFAYNLVTGEDRVSRFIRDNVITLLVYANPDGMTIVSDWYMKNVGTPYEVSPLPELYHVYVGHDNNRDSHVANLKETQNMSRAVNHEWFPHILYNQHQTAPFPARIWIPPESEPTNPNIHPLIVRWKNLIGSAMGKSFEEKGQEGAISRLVFDSWYPGYVTQIVDSHNIPSILTETALYRYATPHFYTINDFPQAHRDLTMGTLYPSPWKGGWWRIGDAVNYNVTASMAVLETAAKYKYEFLINKYHVANDIIGKFNSEPPYGWILSKDQMDPNSAELLIERMLLLGVEVHTANQEFEHDGIVIPAGSYIIPTSQPFGYFVKNVFEKQNYPDLSKYSHLWQGIVRTVTWDGSPLRPYDGVGWTLPIQFGLNYQAMSNNLGNIGKTLITEPASVNGSLSGSGSHYVFNQEDNNSFIALNKIFSAGGKVSRAKAAFSFGGKNYAQGTFIVDGRSVSRTELQNISSETSVVMTGGSARVESEELRAPRIALYKPWATSMDGGWMTLIFENHDFQFHWMVNAEFKAGKLRDRFDVIILPDANPNSIKNGYRKGTIHPDYVGGLGDEGVANLKEFVKKGGILICNNRSSGLPIADFDIPVKNLLQGVPSDTLFIPGAILKMDYKNDNPIAYGMPERGMAFFSGGLAFEIKADSTNAAGDGDGGAKPVVVASYPEEDLLISGWTHGEKKIKGKPAILDVPLGDGHVILFGYNVHNRAQSRSTFKLLFNAIYYK